MAARIPGDLLEHFEGGISILVGTRDASLIPEATRGAGALVHPDREHLTVFLPTDVSQRAIANLRDNGRVAVGFSHPLDAKTLQVKGTVESIRDATDAERAVVERYLVAFAEVLFLAGLPRAITRTMNIWPCHAVTFEVTDLFLQTPGPNAGARMDA
jgi:hypothetical protein